MANVQINAGPRLDRLPLGKFHYRILALISCGGILDTFDIYLAGGVLAAMQHEGFATLSQSAAFLSLTFFGMLIGAATAGLLGDRFGRRFSYQFNLILFGVASLLAAFAPNMMLVMMCRLVMGIGLGAELIVASGTLGEFIPPRFRGRWASVMGLVTSAGLLLATAVGYFVIPAFGWRYMFAIAGVGAVLILIMRKQLPESPRWLESVGRAEEAEDTLKKIEADLERQHGPLEPATSVSALPLPKAPLRDLFSPQLRGRLFAAASTAIAVNVAVYGFVLWLPVYLSQQGQTVTQSLGLATLMSFGSVVGSAVGIVIADRVSRRWSIVATAGLIALFGVMHVSAHGEAMVALTGFALVCSIYLLSNQGMYSYIPELFPTAFRLRGVGAAGVCARAVSIAMPYLSVSLFDRFGMMGVISMINIALLLMALAIIFCGIETRRVPLDDIAPRAPLEPETGHQSCDLQTLRLPNIPYKKYERS